jgi:heptosyltransferase-3
MLSNRTIEIWTYRYHKYLDILLSIYKWAHTYLLIKISKLLNPQREYICVLLAEHFGDIVACEPLSRELKIMYPNSTVYWIVNKSYRELLDYNPNIDVVIEEHSVFFSMLLSKKNSFDHFYNCHLSGLRRYPHLKKTLQNPLAESLNILTDNYFNHGNILKVFAKVGGLPVLTESPRIYIPKSVENKVDKMHFPKKTIVVHCHSNYSPKDWQVYYWERLVLGLMNVYDCNIIEIGLKSTLEVYHSEYYNLCGKLSLLETAEVIKRAQFFIGIDSGPAHFANAVGTFGFLLFGKLGDFENYMPYSGGFESQLNAKFIFKKGQPCSELEYDKVWNVISETIHEKQLVSEISKI